MKYDVIIIGGGSTGCAIFNACSAAGLQTLLIEKGQIGRQTNYSSLGLLQGGLRYLKDDIDLVKNMTFDVGLMKRLAESIAKTQIFVMPIFYNSPHSLTLFDIYLGAYDRFSTRFGYCQPHARLSREEVLHIEPTLSKEVLGAITFDEGICDPIEFSRAQVQSGLKRDGQVLTQTKVDGFFIKNKRIQAVSAKDLLSGHTVTIPGKVFVNAAGPWAPEVAGMAGAEVKLRPTKGSSIIIGKKLCQFCLVTFDKTGQYIAILPYESSALVGPTNVFFDSDSENLDDLKISQEETEYLLDIVNKTLNLELTQKDIIDTKVGLRPQLDHQGVKLYDITHEFAIWRHQEIEDIENFFSIAGGKLSLQMRMAKEMLDDISQALGRKSNYLPFVSTKLVSGQPLEDPTLLKTCRKLYQKRMALNGKEDVGGVALKKKILAMLRFSFYLLAFWPKKLWRR